MLVRQNDKKLKLLEGIKKISLSVEKCIKELIEEVNKNPFFFRMEADVRAWLYNKLCGEHPKFYQTSFPKENPLKTNLVHCEYYGGKRKRIDLVVFDENDVKNITRNWMDKGRGATNNPVKLSDAIEIKVELGYRGKSAAERAAKSDVEKLIELLKKGKTRRGHFIYIIRKWPIEEKWANELFSKLEKICKKYGIKFYRNNYPFFR